MTDGSGDAWPLGSWKSAPPRQCVDEETGVAYEVLTGGVGNNTHVYFNRANFTADGKTLIVRSDRTGSWQIYAYDLVAQRLRRLTEAALDPGRPSIDPCRPVLYYTQGDAVHRLDIDSLEETVVYRHPTPENGTFLLMDISGDGQYLGFMEIGPYDKAEDGPSDFVRRFEARPWTRFWVATADGARVWQVHEEKRHLQHLLFCPTDPTTLMYCHEGPWDRVDQRLWLMRWDGSDIRPLRYQETPDLAIGHEYWCADGRHVDYVRRCAGEPTAVCRVDTRTDAESILTRHGFCHFISNCDGDHIVGDDEQHVALFDVRADRLTPLVRHNQALTIANTLYHPHPAFSPDGTRVVFCRRDEDGHNDVCLIDVEKEIAS
ncbi:MAG: oligogalacturonate lyase family protein [Planctomycetota bacterium]